MASSKPSNSCDSTAASSGVVRGTIVEVWAQCATVSVNVPHFRGNVSLTMKTIWQDSVIRAKQKNDYTDHFSPGDELEIEFYLKKHENVVEGFVANKIVRIIKKSEFSNVLTDFGYITSLYSNAKQPSYGLIKTKKHGQLLFFDKALVLSKNLRSKPMDTFLLPGMTCQVQLIKQPCANDNWSQDWSVISVQFLTSPEEPIRASGQMNSICPERGTAIVKLHTAGKVQGDVFMTASAFASKDSRIKFGLQLEGTHVHLELVRNIPQHVMKYPYYAITAHLINECHKFHFIRADVKKALWNYIVFNEERVNNLFGTEFAASDERQRNIEGSLSRNEFVDAAPIPLAKQHLLTSASAQTSTVEQQESIVAELPLSEKTNFYSGHVPVLTDTSTEDRSSKKIPSLYNGVLSSAKSALFLRSNSVKCAETTDTQNVSLQPAEYLSQSQTVKVSESSTQTVPVIPIRTAVIPAEVNEAELNNFVCKFAQVLLNDKDLWKMLSEKHPRLCAQCLMLQQIVFDKQLPNLGVGCTLLRK